MRLGSIPEPVREDDPRLDPYRDMKARAQRADPERFLAESEHAVLRLLAARERFPLESVLVEPSRAERIMAVVPAGVPLLVLEPERLARLIGFPLHRGVIACARRPLLDPWPPEWLSSRGRWRIVLAAGPSDPVNVGLLARNARAFSADLLLLDAAAGDPLARRAIRSSVGHVFGLPWQRIQDPREALRELRMACPEATFLAASARREATPLQAFEPPSRVVLVLGHEDRGLSPELLGACDAELTIPLDPEVDSLNVAAAAAVFLWALGR